MWILTALLFGSIVTSTHDNEETCRGRAAMLGKIKEVRQLECRSAATGYTVNGSNVLNGLTILTPHGN